MHRASPSPGGFKDARREIEIEIYIYIYAGAHKLNLETRYPGERRHLTTGVPRNGFKGNVISAGRRCS